MKILTRYIMFSVTGTFLVTLAVMTGVLTLGNLLRVADLILRGLNPVLVLRFLGFLVVGLLEYAIPMGILTAVILIFGRLSADNEITGMRACGVGLTAITGPVFILGILLTVLCLYLQNTVIPNNGFAARRLRARIALQDPDALLQPGETIALPGYTINFDRKEGDLLYRVQINQYEQNVLASTIFARKAEVELDRERESFNLKLVDGTLDEITDRQQPHIRTTTHFGTLNFPISLESIYARADISEEDRRKKDMTSGEIIRRRDRLRREAEETARELDRVEEELVPLLAEYRKEGEAAALSLTAGPTVSPGPLSRLPRPDAYRLSPAESLRRGAVSSQLSRLGEQAALIAEHRGRARSLGQEKSEFRKELSLFTTEFQKRLSLSAACLSMIFISIPLAIKTHRSEKTIGMALSLALIFVFYVFVAYADAVAGEPEKLPSLIVWLPNLLFCGLGGFWIFKFTRI